MLIVVLFSSVLHLFWLPKFRAYELSKLSKATQSELSTMANSLIEPVMSGDLAFLYKMLDRIKSERPNWVQIKIENAKGDRLYPLEIQAASKKSLLDFKQEISNEGERVGVLKLKIDVEHSYSKQIDLIQEFEIIFILLLCIVAFIGWLMLNRWLTRPICLLSKLASAITRGNYDSDMSFNGKDELSMLGQSLLSMQHSILTRESKLEYSKEKIRLIINSISDGVFGVDTQGATTFINPAALNMLGYRDSDLVGWRITEIIFDDSNKKAFDKNNVIYESIQSNEPKIVRNEKFTTRSGDVLPVEFKTAPIVNSNGEVTGAVVSFVDISERLAVEHSLRNANQAAKELIQSKSNFIANMSHEIRTPMNGVLGMLQLLRETPINKTQSTYIQTALRSGDRLLELINNILDFSKLEAGKLKIRNRPTNLLELLNDLVVLYSNNLQKPNLKLHLEILIQDSELYRSVDPHRLWQVLTNLVMNAVKFTDEGTITVRVSDAGESQLLFEVIDTGIGISEEDQMHIFNVFEQAKDAKDEKNKLRGGTGLGLALCKEFVALMGGEIGVSSKMTKGSNFWFKLFCPLVSDVSTSENKTKSVAVPSSRKDENERSLENLHVLLAEDNEVNQIIALAMLEGLGLKVDVARNGKIALEYLQRNNYDLILMDLQMPEINGIEATQIIRNLDSNKANVCIIAQTANAMSEDKEVCLKAGMNDYISKPIDQNELRKKLLHWLVERNSDLDSCA